MNDIFGITFIHKKARYKHVADMFCQEDEKIYHFADKHADMLVLVLPTCFIRTRLLSVY